MALYTKVGFRQIPVDGQPMLRYLTYGHTWLILSSLHSHGYHNAGREQLARSANLGVGVVLAVPTPDLGAAYDTWRAEGLPITLEPEDVGFARVFYGLDPDGYEVMFEQFPGG